MNLQCAVYELLGVRPEDQPADYYRLLGVERFESNSEVIGNAAARQILFVERLTAGPYAGVHQDLLDLLRDAKATLLDPQRRRLYDDELRDRSHPLDDHPTDFVDGDEVIDTQAWRDAVREVEWATAGSARRATPHPGAAPAPLPTASDSGLGANPGRRVIADSASCDALATEHEPTAPKHVGRNPRQWVVGADSVCDIVVRSPYVSKQHCRLWETEGVFWIEDLGSRNGTHVNHHRIDGRQPVTNDDLVTLGTLATMPWPDETVLDTAGPQVVTVIHIGRASSNDVVLNDASVSRRHAQLLVCENGLVLTDLGSKNGTFLADSATRVSSTHVERGDSVRIGRVLTSVQDLMEGCPSS